MSQFLAQAKGFSHLQSTHTSCRAHPASYSVDIWSKVAEAWRWPHTPV